MLRFVMIRGVVLPHTRSDVPIAEAGPGWLDRFKAILQDAVSLASVPVLTLISGYLLFGSGLDLGFLAHAPVLLASWMLYQKLAVHIPYQVYWFCTPPLVVAFLVALYRVGMHGAPQLFGLLAVRAPPRAAPHHGIAVGAARASGKPAA